MPRPRNTFLLLLLGISSFAIDASAALQVSAEYLVHCVRVAAGDLNHDGNPDLVTIDNLRSVRIWLGAGDGSFNFAGRYGVGPLDTRPYNLVLGDVNGDGNLDIVTADEGLGGHISVLTGNGDGTFTGVGQFDAPPGARFLALEDFNHDGWLDVAVNTSLRKHTVGILSGNGDGTFQDAVKATTGSSPMALASADFNHDGNFDLFIAGYKAKFGIGTAQILLGNGNGTFTAAHLIPTYTPQPFAALAADVDGDGNFDAAFTVGGGAYYMLGNGDGTLQPLQTLTSTSQPLSIAVGDFNADGIPDLITGGTQVSVHYGNGDGTFQPEVSVDVGHCCQEGIVVADFNRDGLPDAAVASDDALVILTNTGP